MTDHTKALADALGRELRRRRITSLPHKADLMRELGLPTIQATEDWMRDAANDFEATAKSWLDAQQAPSLTVEDRARALVEHLWKTNLQSIPFHLVADLKIALDAQPATQAEPVTVEGEPLFLLHCGQIDSSGEQDEWETQADSYKRVEEFCRLYPGQTIKLYPHTPRAKPAAQAEPVAPTVWEAASKTASMIFASRQDADKWVGQFPASVGGGFQITERTVYRMDAPASNLPAQGVEDERAAFERWGRAQSWSMRRAELDPERYHAWLANTSWNAWQARAALAQAPAAVPLGAAIATEYDEALAQHAADAEKWFARDMKDAARYRWLRENSTEYKLTQKDGYGGRELLGWEALDEAIDAAMAAAKEQP